MQPEYITRAMQAALTATLAFFPTATITGPRQSGKTTMCRHLFPDLPYVNLENIATRNHAVEDPQGFINDFQNGAIIDEIQLVPQILGQLQAQIDEDRFNGRTDKKFILTGSSNFSFIPQLRQSLAGRTAMFTLLPLSSHEIVKAGLTAASPEEEIILGGYPAVWTGPSEATRLILDNYINTYVERDVRKLMAVEDLNKFTLFLRLCASRIGYELNKSALAVETGVSVPTVEKWLSVLSASYVVYLVNPWHSNIGKRLVKTPKLYFIDTGIACTLLGIHTPQQLKGHPMRGPLFENMVVNNTIKWGYNRGLRENVYFYRDKSGREVDIVMEKGDRLCAFEVKAGATFQPEYYKNIEYLKKLLNQKTDKTGVVYSGLTQGTTGNRPVINYRDFPEILEL